MVDGVDKFVWPSWLRKVSWLRVTIPPLPPNRPGLDALQPHCINHMLYSLCSFLAHDNKLLSFELDLKSLRLSSDDYANFFHHLVLLGRLKKLKVDVAAGNIDHEVNAIISTQTYRKDVLPQAISALRLAERYVEYEWQKKGPHTPRNNRMQGLGGFIWDQTSRVRSRLQDGRFYDVHWERTTAEAVATLQKQLKEACAPHYMTREDDRLRVESTAFQALEQIWKAEWEGLVKAEQGAAGTAQDPVVVPSTEQ